VTPTRTPPLAPSAIWTPVEETPPSPVTYRGQPRPAFERLRLGWSATSLPIAPLLLLGWLLGPQGVGLLSSSVLAAIDPAVPVALAVLGVLLGLDIATRRRGARPLLISSSLEATATAIFVGVGVAAAAYASGSSLASPTWLFAISVGICAASSLTVPSANPPGGMTASRLYIEMGVLVPVIIGGALLASARQGSFTAAVSLAIQALTIVIALAGAGWLLLRRTSSETERRVFALAALLLVGGVADYVSSSALLGGLLAGILWTVLGGDPRQSLERDALYAQHPLIALVLLVAGARTEVSALAIGLGAAYVCCRTAARVVGGTIAARAAGPAPGLPLRLVAPGVFGTAFALDVLRAVGPGMSLTLAIVVVGTVLSDVMARLVQPNEVVE
jgi:hypothetical protein